MVWKILIVVEVIILGSSIINIIINLVYVMSKYVKIVYLMLILLFINYDKL